MEKQYFISNIPEILPQHIKKLIEKKDEESIYSLLNNLIEEYVHNVRIYSYRLKLRKEDAETYYPLINKSEEEKRDYFINELFKKYVRFYILPPDLLNLEEKERKELFLKKTETLLYQNDEINEMGLKNILFFLSLITQNNFHENYFTSIHHKYSQLLFEQLLYICKENKDKTIDIEKTIELILHQYIITYEIAVGDTSISYDTHTLFETKLLQLFRSDFFPAKNLYITRLLNLLTSLNQEEDFKSLWTEDLLILLESLIKSDKDFQTDTKQNHLLSSEKELVDYSDTNNVEKIIFLHKLGVLEYLRTKEPFNLSTNLLAEYLSGVTGIKTTTVQSYINPIINNNVQQNKSALHNKNTVEKVEQKLINIGCNIKDLLS